MMIKLITLCFTVIFGVYGLGLVGLLDMPTKEAGLSRTPLTQTVQVAELSFTERISGNTPQKQTTDSTKNSYTLKAMQ